MQNCTLIIYKINRLDYIQHVSLYCSGNLLIPCFIINIFHFSHCINYKRENFSVGNIKSLKLCLTFVVALSFSDMEQLCFYSHTSRKQKYDTWNHYESLWSSGWVTVGSFMNTFSSEPWTLSLTHSPGLCVFVRVWRLGLIYYIYP